MSSHRDFTKISQRDEKFNEADTYSLATAEFLSSKEISVVRSLYTNIQRKKN